MTKKAKLKALIAASAIVTAVMMEATGIAGAVEPIVYAAEQKQSTYTSSYDSKDAAREAGLDLNYEIAAEGAVLLKNENVNGKPALPVKITETVGDNGKTVYGNNKISVFGYNSFHPLGGGSANDVEASAGRVSFSSNFFDSFTSANYSVNPRLRTLYEGTTDNGDIAGDGDIDIETFSLSKFRASYANYNDAAIVILGDSSGTGRKHKFDYSNEQKALVDLVAREFSDKPVIVIINKSVPMEIDWLKNHDGVDAILLMGEGGTNGLNTAGHIINGDINPSGRLVDTYAVAHESNPSWYNYNKLGSFYNADSYMGLYQVEGSDKASDTYMIEYEEGIYVGYKYYETRGYEENQKPGAVEDEWYNANVSYTFGYGKSYTDFTWELLDSSTAAGTVSANGTIKFDIKVTNTGSYAGKDVVELYYTAPYIRGEIEKSYVEIGDFAKTKLLEPGESQTVTLELKVEDMASYDYNDKNGNGNMGYELDAGDYDVKLMRSAHEEVLKRTYTIATTTNVKSESHNLFPDSNNYADTKFDKKLSRADFEGTWPTPLFSGEATNSPTIVPISAEEYAKFTPVIENDDNDVMPTQATDEEVAARPAGAKAPVQLSDLLGKDFDDPLWETLLNQLSVNEMVELISIGGFHSAGMDYIGKPYALDTDGPLGWTGTGVAGNPYNRFCSEPVIASTWSAELCYELGVMVGEQGLWGSVDRTDGGLISAYTGWYAPGMNIHRSPYDARYTEYFSEDGLLVGKIVANVSQGLKSKGGYLFIKHFALHNDGYGVLNSYRGMMNDSKTSGLAVWADEQTMRQIYFKGFEIAVKEGEASGAMSAFNRIGYTWAGANKALLTDLLRTEWGFKGMVITDLLCYGSMNMEAMVRAGGDLMLTSSQSSIDRYKIGFTDATLKTATGVKALRRATQNILWTVLNSNAMQPSCGAKVVLEKVEDYQATATVGTEYNVTFGGSGIGDVNTEYQYSDITYTATGLPEGLTIDAATGVVSGAPTKAGVYTVTVTASANGYESATQEYMIVVSAAENTTPEPTPTPTPTPAPEKGSNVGFIVGLVVMGVVIVALGAYIIVDKTRKNK